MLKMEPRTLCDVGLTIRVSGSGAQSWVDIVDGKVVRFECRTRMLRAVLEGVPLQVSAVQGYFMMERRNGCVRVEFGVPGTGRKTCEFGHQELTSVLDEIESTPV